jgi:hypothetical protein
VYNYVKGKSVVELIFEGIALGLFVIFVLGFTTLNYEIWINGNIPQF